MRTLFRFLFILAAITQRPATAQMQAPAPLPPVLREYRGVWVATVGNIDWPSKPGLPMAQQQRELTGIMDRAVQMRMNMIVLQVRPRADALYASDLEPWSEYLTGRQGKSPGYDPLAFAVAEAHKRGLELHAWFNPFRAATGPSKNPAAPNHVSVAHPEWVRRYGKQMWLDPGDPAARRHSLDVFLDVVRRYDVDGIHIDDYFYPYKEKGEDGRILPFPDDATFHAYRASGGALSRDDWRRDNINAFIQQLYTQVKAVKPWVKVGISPFGIWRPGNPSSVKGFDAYDELYADSRRWLQNGWLDYTAPQLYWTIASPHQGFHALLAWWTQQNVMDRVILAGLYTDKVGGGAKALRPLEISDEIALARRQPGASGHIHFSAAALVKDRNGISTMLAHGVYAQPALPPAMPWLNPTPPAAPALLRLDPAVFPPDSAPKTTWTSVPAASWSPGPGEPAALWLLRLRHNAKWTAFVVPGTQAFFAFGTNAPAPGDTLALSAVSRTGIEGPSTQIIIRR